MEAVFNSAPCIIKIINDYPNFIRRIKIILSLLQSNNISKIELKYDEN